MKFKHPLLAAIIFGLSATATMCARDLAGELKTAVGKEVALEGRVIREKKKSFELSLEISKGIRVSLTGVRDLHEGDIYYVTGTLAVEGKTTKPKYAIGPGYLSKRTKVTTPLEVFPALKVEMLSICGNDEELVQTTPKAVTPAAAQP